MSYRTTRAFERRPSTLPTHFEVIQAFGREFGKQMDWSVARGLAAVAKLLGGVAATR